MDKCRENFGTRIYVPDVENMDFPDIKQVAIVGSGDMGHGIAEVCAIAGFEVCLVDVKQDFLEKAMLRIHESLQTLARKKKVPKDQIDSILGRIQTFIDISEASQSAQLAIEAVPEVLDLKKTVFTNLDAILPPESIIATNTSNMSISELANVTSRAAHVAGLHFFNPVVLMKSVELIRGQQTSDETTNLLADFAQALGKIPLIVKKDSAGFAVNRVLIAAQVLAVRAVEAGIIAPVEVEASARKMGLPMGPFETMDYVGLDVVVHGFDYFAENFGADYAAPPWMKHLFENGELGKKTGAGVLDWSTGRPAIDLTSATDKVTLLDLIAVQINEATKLLEEGIVDNLEDVDFAIKNGTGNPAGFLNILKSLGKDKICGICERFADELSLEIFRPTKTLREWN